VNREQSTVNKIKCGVVGVGSLGQHHARIYASLPGAEFAGIFETDNARAKEICAKHNCRRFATLDELGEACDAVSIVVPTKNQHAMLKRCVESVLRLTEYENYELIVVDNGSDEADACAYLASSTGKFVTGEVLTVDGGQQLWGDMWPTGRPDYFRL